MFVFALATGFCTTDWRYIKFLRPLSQKFVELKAEQTVREAIGVACLKNLPKAKRGFASAVCNACCLPVPKRLFYGADYFFPVILSAMLETPLRMSVICWLSYFTAIP
jgi:hypothetical protein